MGKYLHNTTENDFGLRLDNNIYVVYNMYRYCILCVLCYVKIYIIPPFDIQITFCFQNCVVGS